MNNIKSLIISTYTSKPKHFTQILKRNPEVLKYISKNVPLHITEFLEQLYYIVHEDAGICEYGQKMKLKSFEKYSFCGKATVCKCAKESVSISVSNTKKSFSTEKNKEINNKREQTTLKKYNISNVGLLDISVKNHTELYNNKEKVKDIIDKVSRTKLSKYGHAHFNNRNKAQKTCIKKYGVKNTWDLTEFKSNPNLEILKDKEKLSKLFPLKSVHEISEELNVHQQTVYYYLNLHGFREPYKSTFEIEIVAFLNSMGITNIIRNSRKIISKELDIYLPDHKLAIEYNGIYWHHDKVPYITKTYHKNKFDECESNGIELFTIFSDTWETKKEIWKAKIKNKLGLSEKIYARNTEVVSLNISETKDILNKNHIQGFCTSMIAYGLTYNDELVAVMTFSKCRNGIGKFRGNDSYELVRFVSSKSVIGGASKLLKKFIKTHNPSIIVSYSDNQYSIGNLYNKLGFTLESNSNIGYKYYDTKSKKMYHRYNFTKHKLVKMGFSSTKTEKEIMDELGYLRIWDCGSKTWIMKL